AVGVTGQGGGSRGHRRRRPGVDAADDGVSDRAGLPLQPPAQRGADAGVVRGTGPGPARRRRVDATRCSGYFAAFAGHPPADSQAARRPLPISLKRLVPAFLGAILVATPAAAQTLEQMAGQMVAVGFVGDAADDASVKALREEIAAGGIGGVMFLKTNVASLGAVKRMNDAFRAASPELPPLITLDQEGGAVERLTEAVGFREIPNARAVAQENSPEAAGRIYGEMAEKVAEVGFTVNFGPVVDLDLNPDNQIIAKYGRSFSKTPKTVVAYAEAFVEAHREAGLLTALKHFPGHGSSPADSHEGFVDITRSWQEAELIPYQALIGAGLA